MAKVTGWCIKTPHGALMTSTFDPRESYAWAKATTKISSNELQENITMVYPAALKKAGYTATRVEMREVNEDG